MLLNGLAVNTGKTKYMEIGSNLGVIANAQIKIGSNSYEKVKTFKYLGTSPSRRITEPKQKFSLG